MFSITINESCTRSLTVYSEQPLEAEITTEFRGQTKLNYYVYDGWFCNYQHDRLYACTTMRQLQWIIDSMREHDKCYTWRGHQGCENIRVEKVLNIGEAWSSKFDGMTIYEILTAHPKMNYGDIKSMVLNEGGTIVDGIVHKKG